MILTGSEITREREQGRICIHPFDAAQVNPNSYNYRLGSTLKVYREMKNNEPQFDTIRIPEEGYVLRPRVLYLGHTLETLGSSTYALSLIGRSSIGRLGLFVQYSANLGHTGTSHQWTLEFLAAKPFRLHAGMKIGQVSFWTNEGEVERYRGAYGAFNEPHESVLAHAELPRI